MNSILEFRGFPKLARLSRTVTITEKLDGTNSQVVIAERTPELEAEWADTPGLMISGEFFIRAGSRNRWLNQAADNFGFAKWVSDNRAELCSLGVGQHFGEWWGAGIQRNYGLKEKRFSLFNTAKWSDPAIRPACCHVVPVLETCNFDTGRIAGTLAHLICCGSAAAPGFRQPEGIVVYHSASGRLFKKTCEHDEQHKSQL